jgi:tetratricopeptide (TPR) repeat protein
LVQGFRTGQLSLKKEVPLGLKQLANPYDGDANLPYRTTYRMNDLSYYKGRFYLYFGITPALILFWPVVALTGHYLSDNQAVTIFCAAGFLASVGLLHALWRRYFAEVSVAAVAAGALALGLAAGVPVLLSRSNVYEVAISCGYMLTMLALGAIWCALHETQRGWRWLAAASVAYGLAVGSRPNLLFGAVILLVPVLQAWRERRRISVLLMAATGPITLIGLGLMLYNYLRFGSPFELGWHYVVGAVQHVTVRSFSPHYLWFNFRVYFLEPARWSGRFPFVHQIAVPPMPAGYLPVEGPFGILSNIPVVWLALAAPLAWRGRSGQAGSVLRWFVMAAALLSAICALTLGFYHCATFRYEVDFLPALLLLAVVGILALERMLVPASESGLSGRTAWRRAVRFGWGLLVGFSVVFNLLASVEYYAVAHNNLGIALSQEGKLDGAIWHFKQAVRINPGFAGAHNNLGNALLQLSRPSEAMKEYAQALQIKPDYAEAHYNFGNALVQLGRLSEAAAAYEQALRIDPGFAEAHGNLGNILARMGRAQDAIRHFELALQTKPDFAKAHHDLANALFRLGRAQEAIGHYKRVLRIKPDYAEAHYNLGVALQQVGKAQEAMEHYEQALRIKPDYAEAHNNLGNALLQLGRLPEATVEYAQALRIQPDLAEAHYNLGLALARLGKSQEAIKHWEQALQIQPDYVDAHYNLGVALEQAGRGQEAIGHYEQALRLKPDFAKAQQRLARLRAAQ